MHKTPVYFNLHSEWGVSFPSVKYTWATVVKSDWKEGTKLEVAQIKAINYPLAGSEQLNN